MFLFFKLQAPPSPKEGLEVADTHSIVHFVLLILAQFLSILEMATVDMS